MSNKFIQDETNILLKQIKYILLNRAIPEDLKFESDSFMELQEAFFYISNCLIELNNFSKELSMGNLEIDPPSRHNFIAGSLKELHSGLKHLTWQANQVAIGDYSQQVSFLGDFSVSFNKMIAQLSEREIKLKYQSRILEETNSMMMSIMDGLKDWIIVTEKDTGDIIYANQSAKDSCYNVKTKNHICGQTCKLISGLKEYSQDNSEAKVFDYYCLSNNKSLRVQPFLIQWNNNLAYVHYILDITNEKVEREQIEELIYTDELTQVFNRRYCMIQLEKMLEDKIHFSFSMIDLDGLKYANDNFGHSAGDDYLKSVTREIRNITRSNDIICRLGGDEFTIIFPRCNPEIAKCRMEQVNERLSSYNKAFPMSISYGVMYFSGLEENVSLNELILKADEKMYDNKNKKRKVRET